MWSRKSPSSVFSTWRRFMTSFFRWRWRGDQRDGGAWRVPLAGFDLELLPALCGQSVELGASIVLGGAFVERNPATFDQAVKRWIQGSLLHQEDVIRAVFDRFRNRMAVRSSPPKGAQNEKIQGALEEFDAGAIVPSRHSRWQRYTAPPRTSR